MNHRTFGDLAGLAHAARTRLLLFVALAHDRRRGEDVRMALRIQRGAAVSALADLLAALLSRGRTLPGLPSDPLPAPIANLAQTVMLEAQVEVALMDDGLADLDALARVGARLADLGAALRRAADGETDTHVAAAIGAAMRSAARARQSRNRMLAR